VRQLSQVLGSLKVLQASFHNAQYLPEWRPGRDYRATSSAQRSLGGGVLRDLSHEIDLLHHFVGVPTRAFSTLSRLGDLEIDTEDTVSVQFEFGDGRCAHMYLSYLDRVPRRSFFLRTSTLTIYGDLLTGSLSINENHFSYQTDRDMSFLEMHRDVLAGGGNAATYEQGFNVLRTIDLIETGTTIFGGENI
jgi:predicted dehydrogenase